VPSWTRFTVVAAALLASVRSWRYSASEIRRFRQRIASALVLPAAILRRY